MICINSRWQICNWVIDGIIGQGFLFGLFVIIGLFVSVGSSVNLNRPSFQITHTDVNVTLNDDCSADLDESFIYTGYLPHGPIVKIESGGNDIDLNGVKVKRAGHENADKLHSVGEFDDMGDLRNELEHKKNSYGYYNDGGNTLYVLVNDPLNDGERYTINTNVTESNVMDKHGVVRWNILGSANQVDLGSVNVHIKNDSLQKAHSFYLQGRDGVVACSPKFDEVGLKIKHYKKSDHLDLRTNLPYTKAVILTRILQLWTRFGVEWVVLFLLIFLYVCYVRSQLLGSSMAIPDLIFSDLPKAIYLTSGFYNEDLVAGLLTKRVLNRDLNVRHYKKTALEKEVLCTYYRVKPHDVDSSNDLRSMSTTFEEEFPFYKSKEIVVAKQIFLFALKFIIYTIPLTVSAFHLSFFRVFDMVNLFLILFMLTLFIDFHERSSVSFGDLENEIERTQLIRLANGLMDVNEIRKLHLKDAGLWTDLISWAVGVSLNDEIIDELSKRGYELGFFKDPEVASSAYDSFSTTLHSSYNYGSSFSSSSGGGSFGGGDAGGGSGAGGW